MALGHIEKLVLGLLALGDLDNEEISQELNRPYSQISRTVVRLMDKGYLTESRRPVARDQT